MVTVVEDSTVVGWTNIARNLGVAVRTAQDYEKELGLPVKRLRGKVYADPQELFDWKVEENNRRRKMSKNLR